MRRAMQKCLRSARRSITASSAMAGWSPRADMAALRAERAVAMRCALESESEDGEEFMACFLSGLRQNADTKAGRKSGGITAGERPTRILGAGGPLNPP